ncbi:hypothetical protein [Paraburkholderia tropica]|uniref:hypothetical protein n=1 Tax=Paraburkholderia tropica TaxID=92647 RepID=UPI0031D9D291
MEIAPAQLSAITVHDRKIGGFASALQNADKMFDIAHLSEQDCIESATRHLQRDAAIPAAMHPQARDRGPGNC